MIYLVTSGTLTLWITFIKKVRNTWRKHWKLSRKRYTGTFGGLSSDLKAVGLKHPCSTLWKLYQDWTGTWRERFKEQNSLFRDRILYWWCQHFSLRMVLSIENLLRKKPAVMNI